MTAFCLSCWFVMVVDSLCMKFFYEEIKRKQWLKKATVYLWLLAILLGVASGISIIITGVAEWKS